ncbi:MAG: hypothetical protein H6819_07730 [Phycisphaerales bacterium]|nr:hypothetical protein [Phycisphaerales bacterium]MCB9854335.1 hypothetical protein [Phycisphaerales bacterium]MCB9863536.1 hypothetical protein [Phycisphaerales bacterium]
MMHSSPMPLNVALDMTKRLHHELAKYMTPEQRRDMTRVERLIQEAQQLSKTQAVRAEPHAGAPATGAGANKSGRRRAFW